MLAAAHLMKVKSRTKKFCHYKNMDRDDNHQRASADMFTRYIEICNESLLRNKDRFPFKQIISAAREAKEHKYITVQITPNAPSKPLIIYLKQRIHLATEVDKTMEESGIWMVDKTYIERVISHADEYIENPAKINWEWLY